jgi:serine/threonine protein kinase
VWRVAYGVLLALHDCHNRSEKILHRDLKPANVFLDKDGNIKVGTSMFRVVGRFESHRCLNSLSHACLLTYSPVPAP